MAASVESGQNSDHIVSSLDGFLTLRLSIGWLPGTLITKD